MIWIGEREIIMPRGWVVQYKDGSIICENEMPWGKVPNKREIARMYLKWEDRMWSLDDKENYTAPGRREYFEPNTGRRGLHSRTIGYYDTEGKCRVLMRVEETTGRMSYETEAF